MAVIFQFHFREMFGFDVFVVDFTVACPGPSAAGFPGAGVEVFQVGIDERVIGKPCVGDNDAG